jgi:hypothetical protein
MVVRLPGKQKVRSSSLAKEYLFLRSIGIPSRCLVPIMSHNIRHSHCSVCSKDTRSRRLPPGATRGHRATNRVICPLKDMYLVKIIILDKT